MKDKGEEDSETTVFTIKYFVIGYQDLRDYKKFRYRRDYKVNPFKITRQEFKWLK